MKNNVQIIGLSIKDKFGCLSASELKFSPEKDLYFIKGEVGAGKSTLNTAMRLTTQGSDSLEDKSLYGDNVNIEAELCDGDTPIFISAKSKTGGGLNYTLYTKDANGKQIKNPVIDGVKATPAEYLKKLQTALTWRLNELTSENPTTQRNILLELYASELEATGVVFDKRSPKYVGNIIDQIEKAKNERSLMDMRRKEVGGIAEDLKAKGVNFDERRVLKDISEITATIKQLEQEIYAKKNGGASEKALELEKLKNAGMEASNKLKELNGVIEKRNEEKKRKQDEWLEKLTKVKSIITDIYTVEYADEVYNKIGGSSTFDNPEKTLSFSEKGSITSQPDEFEGEMRELLEAYHTAGKNYVTLKNTPDAVIDTTQLDASLASAQKELEMAEIYNQQAKSINTLWDWKDADANVNQLQKDYYLKLTEINTGVEGLKIVPVENDIFLMYDGSYDPEYFSNPNKELRKLSGYSDTQKPMICLLIQQYLLSKKTKTFNYLWIDHVPIDNKTKVLLEKMCKDLNLKLFVSWTGDFNHDELKDGEILVENGEIILGTV